MPHHQHIDLSEKTAGYATRSTPLGPGDLWKTKGLELPHYIRNVARGIMRTGKSKSRAIAMAIAAIKRWARGGDDVSPEVRAASIKALAQLNAARAKAKATPNRSDHTATPSRPLDLATRHRAPAGTPQGGQFITRQRLAELLGAVNHTRPVEVVTLGRRDRHAHTHNPVEHSDSDDGEGERNTASVELASVKIGDSYQHVPGTAYHWRHGWHPLDVWTAMRWRKKDAADRLHREGAAFYRPDKTGPRQVPHPAGHITVNPKKTAPRSFTDAVRKARQALPANRGEIGKIRVPIAKHPRFKRLTEMTAELGQQLNRYQRLQRELDKPGEMVWFPDENREVSRDYAQMHGDLYANSFAEKNAAVQQLRLSMGVTEDGEHALIDDIAPDSGPSEDTMRQLQAVLDAGSALDAEAEKRLVPLREREAAARKRYEELTTQLRESLALPHARRQQPDVVERERTIRAARNAAADEWGKARNEHLAQARDTYLGLLSQVRDMGDKATPIPMNGSVAAARKAFAYAQQHYPKDWVDHARQRTAPTGGVTLVRPLPGGRGFFSQRHYQRGKGFVQWAMAFGAKDHNDSKVPDAPKRARVAIHETGHLMETTVPGIKALEWAYQWRRTSTGKVGQRTRDGRNALTGMHGYGPREVSRHDEYPNAYTGKEYGGKPTDPWELLTTAAESLFAGSTYLDDDLRRWALGMLATV